MYHAAGWVCHSERCPRSWPHRRLIAHRCHSYECASLRRFRTGCPVGSESGCLCLLSYSGGNRPCVRLRNYPHSLHRHRSFLRPHRHNSAGHIAKSCRRQRVDSALMDEQAHSHHRTCSRSWCLGAWEVPRWGLSALGSTRSSIAWQSLSSLTAASSSWSCRCWPESWPSCCSFVPVEQLSSPKSSSRELDAGLDQVSPYR